VVLYHHEKFDGNGYPCGLQGEDIPLEARTFAVIDTLDAMTFARPYRGALPFAAVVAELQRESGRHFDPEIVKMFLEIPERAWDIENRRERVGRESASSMRNNLT
jgi:putative two-component system response regulator